MLGLTTRVVIAVLVCVGASLGQTGTTTTLAGITPAGGDPARGFSGDGGDGILAALALAQVQNGCDPNRYEQTVHLSVDAKGNVYFPDSNNQRIRKISPQGIISTIAGNGSRTATNQNCEPSSPVGDNQSALLATFFNPADALILPNGNLVIADEQDNRIRQIAPGGAITTIGGNGHHNLYAPGIPATSSPMDWPSALAVIPKALSTSLKFTATVSARSVPMDDSPLSPAQDFPATTATTSQRPGQISASPPASPSILREICTSPIRPITAFAWSTRPA